MKSIRSTLGAALFIFSSLIQFSSGLDACGEAAKQLAESKSGLIPAEVAYKCLIDVPFHKEDATTTLQQMHLFLQFYSAQEYFAHPPTDELELRPVDMNKTLDDIESNIKNGKYSNEYSFYKDLFDLFGDYRDGHVQYVPYCYSAFLFTHPYSLISISETPDQVPEVYGVEITKTDPNIKDKATKINGQDVITYLTNMANTHPELQWIDPDARWNQLLVHYSDGRVKPGIFAKRYSYEDLTITWESGSTTKVDWVASFDTDLAPFNSTDSFYSNVCVRSEADIEAARMKFSDETVGKEKRSVPSLHSLEKRAQNSSHYSTLVPVKSMPDGTLGLYLLDDQVAVLTMSSFQPEDNNYLSFASFITEAIIYIQKAGIKKIIIDVTGNEGGYLNLGEDAAMQFFPTADHFFGTNMRWNHALETMLTEGLNPDRTYWDIGHYHRMDGSNFSSYKEFLGPVYKDGDYFTEIARPNFVEMNDEAPKPLPKSYPGPQPFDTENILLVSSGMCGSTCAVFAEAMVEQGVRCVAFGGRPRDGPMQCVGGIKGSQVMSFDEIAAWAVGLLGSDVSKYNYIPDVTKVATYSARINLRNSWRKDDQDTPIEFIYAPADYKLSYTPDMIEHPQVKWAAAKNVAWLGAKYLGNGTSDHTSVDAVAGGSKSKNKANGVDGDGVVDESNDDRQKGVKSWSSIGELIWQKIRGRGDAKPDFIEV